ncbi:TetR family transcriptional regulator [Streptomyces sp. AV19]|uniref:TetR/AcrR family transcriptional regulator n=1 Tax=Streptomyces sp. AV19 TaxID=2793068 RepID=UPI0018FE98D0|nr:TetR/AcrR family transcriptional regulator [Streptomyces sp. AV19]MBH1937437.1 TetR family transcriptional regulator [Streptomyces sp. AV19]MDG4533790.1 TetR/AcrR family transcriptional regulator [Streptomyces sp. AV19]
MNAPTGRRERKKAQTRKALADAALELILDRGYDQVGVKDVADAADVSVTTLFKHFPCKEALLFDLDQDIEAALVAAVRDRAPGVSVPRALREHLITTVGPHTLMLSPHTPIPHPPGEQPAGPRLAEFSRMVDETPALREYAHRMWMRHETALARAIAEETGAPEDDPACAALARFALDAPLVARRHPDPYRAMDEIFALLERGWGGPSGR